MFKRILGYPNPPHVKLELGKSPMGLWKEQTSSRESPVSSNSTVFYSTTKGKQTVVRKWYLTPGDTIKWATETELQLFYLSGVPVGSPSGSAILALAFRCFGSLAFSQKWGGILPVEPHFRHRIALEFWDQLPLRDHQCLKDGSHSISGSWETLSS